MKWPRPLQHFVQFPNENPVCVAVCPFRHYCSDWVQRGISKNCEKAILKSHHDCLFYAGLITLSKEEFGRKPESANEFQEMAGERVAIAEDV